MNVTMPWKAPGDASVKGVATKVEEVRNLLSKEADHLAELAAHYGREAGAHASDIADDATKQASRIASEASEKAQKVARDPAGSANSWIQQLIKAVAGLGTALVLASRKTANDLGENAQVVAQDLRKVRITTEPKKTGPDFMPGITLLAGFGAGIALMYFLDPERGRARRKMLRDKLASVGKPWTKDPVDNTAQTQIWPTNGPSPSDDMIDGTEETSATGFVASDTSTTDTWGEQPQPASSSIESH